MCSGPGMPPYATLYPPLRFGIVESGVSVGAYPTLRHFRFLRRHSITVVLSLTPEPPTADLVAWSELCNVTLLHIKVYLLEISYFVASHSSPNF